MKDWEQENNKQKHQFKSYYCAGCRQSKPCGLLTSWDSDWKSYCCACYYQSEQNKSQEYSTYKKVLKSKQKENKEKFQQLQLLKDYQGCKKCQKKRIDAYSLYENNKLVCWACLVKKEGGASSPISFTEQSRWYQKCWGINLKEWLEKGNLPVNRECVSKWLKDKEHLRNCACFEQESQQTYVLFSNFLQKSKEKLKQCSCEKSEKVRVRSDDYAWCEICEGIIAVASKKRVIKNRNDPRFWGIKSKWEILCLECVGKRFYQSMEEWQRKKFREYRRRGYE
jgi:hypothetical protein